MDEDGDALLFTEAELTLTSRSGVWILKLGEVGSLKEARTGELLRGVVGSKGASSLDQGRGNWLGVGRRRLGGVTRRLVTKLGLAFESLTGDSGKGAAARVLMLTGRAVLLSEEE